MPEGEYHEIGLLFVYFLLKQEGIYVNYLGANVPMKDLVYLTAVKKPNYVFCHLTSPSKVFKIDRFLTQIGQVSNTTPVMLSGLFMKDYKGKLSENIAVKKSLAEVIQLIQTI